MIWEKQVFLRILRNIDFMQKSLEKYIIHIASRGPEKQRLYYRTEYGSFIAQKACICWDVPYGCSAVDSKRRNMQ
jgi:hypothetical protein